MARVFVLLSSFAMYACEPQENVPTNLTIHDAAKAGNLEGIKHILATRPADLSKLDEQGNTPLMWASEKGQQAAAKLLIAKGADVNQQNAEGFTALYSASLERRES
jgi:ankyrin repeat protein